jgi:hypothetical protein
MFSMTERLKYRCVDHSTELKLLVNQAQAHKWNGDDATCQRILSCSDWSASSDVFLVCIHVLREQFDQAAQIVKRIGPRGDMPLINYSTWAVFRKARENQVFRSAVEEVFKNKLDYGAEPDNFLSNLKRWRSKRRTRRSRLSSSPTETHEVVH